MKFLFPYMARWKAVNWTRYHQIFTKLAEMGHDVYVLQPPASDINETNFQEIEVNLPEKLHLIEVPVNKKIWNLKLPFNKLIKKGYYSLKCEKIVCEMIKEYGIDAVLLYNIPQYRLLKKLKNKCFTIFDLADDYVAMLKQELGRFRNKFLIFLGSHMLNTMVADSNVSLAVSKVLAEDFSNRVKKHIKVLPNGVDFNKVKKADGSLLKEKYSNPVIGFIGSFEYFIDFDLILAAAKRLPKLTFLLVGTGRDMNYVKEQITVLNLDNVVLTGGVPHDDVASHIDAMDVCLNIFKKIPISHGASPIKLFEYIAMRKPVISTRLHEVENIDRGFLFYADTVEELVVSIQNILNKKNELIKVKEKAYNIIENDYNWDIIASELLRIVKDGKNYNNV